LQWNTGDSSTGLSCPNGRISSLEEVEKKHILLALGELDGNLTRTAKALRISLSTLKRKLKAYKNSAAV
jgi:transcriptional regulator with PAS, ATPase and Fis domain